MTRRVCRYATAGGYNEGRATAADNERYVTGAVNGQMTMNTPQIEVWNKVHRKNKWKVARPNKNHEVGARIIYKSYMKGGEVKKYR